MLRPRCVAVFGFIALLGACSDSEKLLTSAEVQAPDSRAIAANKVARQIAAAMSHEDVRAAVRDAMRASLYVEHKVTLQEFLRTEAGHRLAEAAARASGTSVADFHRDVAALPEMDFYVPFRQHRLEWQGTGDVLVGGTMNVDDRRLAAYTPGGARMMIDARAGAPAPTLIVLHPAEPKGIRIGAQAALRAPVIQDPSDGELALTVITRHADGKVTQVEMGALHPRYDIDGDCPEGGGDPIRPCSNGGPGGTLYYQWPHLKRQIVTWDDGVGSQEVEYVMEALFGSRDYGQTKTLRYTGVEPNVWYTRNHIAMYPPFRVQVWEDDFLSNDFYGEAQVNWTTATEFVASCWELYSDTWPGPDAYCSSSNANIITGRAEWVNP